MEYPEQGAVEELAGLMAAACDDFDRRLEGIRTDFEVALLRQHEAMVKRLERLEALVAQRLAANVDELLAELQR